jgi:gliding motility-associated-like protein
MKIKTLFTFIALALVNVINAQITASATQGCAPMQVTFSVATPSTTGIYYWNFKNGGFGQTTTANPLDSTTFNTPNTYLVEVSETSGGTPKYTKTITVFSKPTIFLTATPPKGCAPLNTSLTVTPTKPAGVTINNYTWDFGDGNGNPSGTASQTHIYSNPGTYDVSVGIETNFPSCNVTPKFPAAVYASAPPIANFTPSPASSCSAPLTVSFTNNSSSPSNALPLTYAWNLGSGIINTNVPSPITYTVAGNYTVSLTATDANNCKGNTTIQTISIGTPVSSFTLPATICIGTSYQITNTSTAGYSNWMFGATASPTSSGATNPTVSFSTPGTHTITLTTTSYSGACSSSPVTQTVFVEAPATFTTSPSYSCNNTQVVNFTASSPNTIASWNWTFNDSTPNQTGKNINHTFSLPIFNLNWQGVNWKKGRTIYTTTLTATTTSGCTTIMSLNDTLDKPCAFFNTDNDSGCAPLNVLFTDKSWTDETITQWQWNFGDGSAVQTLNNGTPLSHTFVNYGTYVVSLIITNNRGCTDTMKHIIKVGKKFPVSFTANPSPVCPLVTVNFTNTSPNKYLFDQWEWISDSGYFDVITTNRADTLVSWKYRHSIGNQAVVLIGRNNGCESKDTQYVFIKGPIAIFSIKQICSKPSDVVFTDQSLGAISLSWNLGDGSPLSNATGTFTHTYTPGIYTATLTASNNTSGCPNFDTTATFRIYDLKARFTSPTNLCIGQTYTFNAATSQDNASSYNPSNPPPNVLIIPGLSGYGGFYWMYGDPTKNPDTVNSYYPIWKTSFNTPGIQTVSLVVWDSLGCSDIMTKYIKVYNIKAQYTISDYAICFPAPAETFSNTSTSDTLITSWKWTFGDGATTTYTNSPSPFTHTYTAPILPNFTTKLVIADKLGCKDSTIQTITTYTPTSTASAVASNVCSGTPVTLSGTDYTSQGSHLTYNWSFDDGSTPIFNANNIPHTYTTSGTYTTTLNFTEVGSGCSGSTTVKVNVQNYPTALFTAINSSKTLQNNGIVCLDNPQVSFTDISTDDNFSLPLTTQWDLGTGSFVTTSPNPKSGFKTFSKGIQVIRLKSSTSYGCSSTATMTLNVVGPQGDFTPNKTSVCKGDAVTFTLMGTQDIGSYFFDFGDGTGSPIISNPASYPPVTHVYKVLPSTGSSYDIKLNLSGINGVCPIAPDHIVNIYDVKANFTRNSGLDTTVCLGQNILLTNTSSALANTFTWNLSDGTPISNSATTFNHLYADSGKYNISLAVSNSTYGCKDTTVKKVIIYALPVVTAVGDTICKDHKVSLYATKNSNYKYAWLPGSELNSSTVYNPNLTGTQSETFTVTVTDTNNCTNTATAPLFVVQPLTAPPSFDTSIVIGDTIKLPIAKQNNMEHFSWTPETGLSCTDCPFPKVQPLEDITYTVLMKDSCTEVTETFIIHIKPEMFIDLPTTFTPNGDGTNDIIYVKGWGIKDLISFDIYNRWGELVFTTSNIAEGWNGYYKGMLQNNDTYVWKVKALTWRNTTLVKEGHFNLMR